MKRESLPHLRRATWLKRLVDEPLEVGNLGFIILVGYSFGRSGDAGETAGVPHFGLVVFAVARLDGLAQQQHDDKRQPAADPMKKSAVATCVNGSIEFVPFQLKVQLFADDDHGVHPERAEQAV